MTPAQSNAAVWQMLRAVYDARGQAQEDLLETMAASLDKAERHPRILERR